MWGYWALYVYLYSRILPSLLSTEKRLLNMLFFVTDFSKWSCAKLLPVVSHWHSYEWQIPEWRYFVDNGQNQKVTIIMTWVFRLSQQRWLWCKYWHKAHGYTSTGIHELGFCFAYRSDIPHLPLPTPPPSFSATTAGEEGKKRIKG